ncbi:adenosylcobinamide-GDP ribazoletransferase [Paludicola sp. MB14-C6]|uniref:adenosylcobinamide-GDP ribazoletransferase n=1 Tax=Paludihabitans sp. MB14-C6 TaxID=3070656 RepID=UPI0027DABF1A|nr:adenosylcobinamide-GDP ribazoletransferase [Paludicola sp. MB14-C6]WMJ22046.1 adenosylcobinamide-GDP ribazoletransferase [Paludicola sp. MB14-C6]
MVKDIISGLVTAFSMYSIVPMPQMEWNKNTMKYAMCFFPLIGLLIGGVVYGATALSSYFKISPLLYSAILVFIPIIISGAIHLDGLIDTGDALYSRLERERKLEILKDPHVGAFGVILCGGYLLLSFGVAGQFYQNTKLLPFLCLGYILSRGYSALSIVSFKTAKNSGLAYIFSDNASKKTVKITSLLYIIIAYVGMLFINPIIGMITLALSLGRFILFKMMCYKKFGGLTGDLAGYLLCTIEFIILCISAFGVMI